MFDTTKALVDSRIEYVDGPASVNDAQLKRRWRQHAQNASGLMWNDRFWQFKNNAATIPFSADPTVKNYLPSDFGSFESAVGDGVFGPLGSPPIVPCLKSEMVNLKARDPQRVGTPAVWCVSYDTTSPADANTGKPYLDLHPIYAVETPVTVQYLRRQPRLQYIETDEGLEEVDTGEDELAFFPWQWRELIAQGAEWIGSDKTGNALSKSAHEIWKAGLDQMRAREACVIRALQPYRPHRMGRRGR